MPEINIIAKYKGKNNTLFTKSLVNEMPLNTISHKTNETLINLGCIECKPLFNFSWIPKRYKKRMEIIDELGLRDMQKMIFNTDKKEKKLFSKLKKIGINAIEIDLLTKDIFPNQNPFNKNVNNKPSKITQKTPLDIINYKVSSKQNGCGVMVAVVDTGIDYKHPFLQKNLWKGWKKLKGFYGINLTTENKWHNVFDARHHGTNISGIIASNHKKLKGIAYKANLLTIKSTNYKTTENHISYKILAITLAYILGADVINCSWYVDTGDGEKYNESLILKKLFKYLKKYNCIPVFAASNENQNVKNIYPQNQEDIIVVGSLTQNKKRSPYSCWGEKITVWAPSENIKTTGLSHFGIKEHIIKKGKTSMAAAFVSGTIALLKQQQNNISLDEIKELIKNTKCEKIQEETNIIKPLYGHILNIKNYLN